MDKEEGKKEAQKKEKAHRGNQKTFLQTFAEATSGEQTKALNHGASVKEQDSIQAGIEIETDRAALGFYTSCVMVWDKDLKTAQKKADVVKNIINSAGFTCKEETFNALEAWKSMLPGQVYANFRALPVMTTNLSHVLPLSSVWAGMRRNEHAFQITGCALPHLTCSTAEGTPFFLNINVNDVGHTAVWGPTGAGKSTFLNLLELQFFKYPASQVIVFDKGRSCRQPCLASGGLFYEPAGEGTAGVAFQPLRDLESDSDMLYAQEFIEACFIVNDYSVTPPLSAAIRKALEDMRGIPVGRRTMTTFVQYADAFKDPETNRAVFKEKLGDYLWAGGKYGKIFDSSASGLSLDTRFLAIEMEELMNRGEGCVVPALVYLFNLVENMFDGKLTLLVLDEAWLFLKNEIFAEKIAEWLKVLRKKNVFVVFATHDVADVEKSPLKTTIIQQCLTKIYLADPSALTAGMTQVYQAFGLSDAEIAVIAGATMKRDYFYTSSLGRRLFRLDLGSLTLALIGSPDHPLLDSLLKEKGGGVPLCADLLERKGVDYGAFLGADAPSQETAAASSPVSPETVRGPVPPEEYAGITDSRNDMEKRKRLFKAVSKLKHKKRDGSGRATKTLAAAFNDKEITEALIKSYRTLCLRGSPEIIERFLSDCDFSITAANKEIKRREKEAGSLTPAGTITEKTKVFIPRRGEDAA
jgi:type IV secretion system protein VirB4